MTRIALITGASRGIGAATAKHLAKAGYAICVNYLSNKVAAERVVAEINRNGGKGISMQADVSNEQEEAADSIAYLPSYDASYVTGSFIDIAGGR